MKPGRLKGTFATFKAAAALFGAVFVLLAFQLMLGNDPAVGGGRDLTAQADVSTGQAPEESFLDRATALLDIQSPAEDDDPEQDSEMQAEQAPAPVQSETS
jgi:hypothetical protein